MPFAHSCGGFRFLRLDGPCPPYSASGAAGRYLASADVEEPSGLATTLPAIGDVNALSGNGDNLDAEPLYADRPLDDYTLGAGSPAIDQGHANAPASVKVDAAGGARSKDGDSSGTAEPDLGAYER